VRELRDELADIQERHLLSSRLKEKARPLASDNIPDLVKVESLLDQLDLDYFQMIALC
jgi:hypothetical protein